MHESFFSAFQLIKIEHNPRTALAADAWVGVGQANRARITRYRCIRPIRRGRALKDFSRFRSLRCLTSKYRNQERLRRRRFLLPGVWCLQRRRHEAALQKAAQEHKQALISWEERQKFRISEVTAKSDRLVAKWRAAYEERMRELEPQIQVGGTTSCLLPCGRCCDPK